MEMSNLFRTYNISPAMSASIIPLNEAESRGLFLHLEEPPELASRIAGYDALFSTGLSKDYVEKREFSPFISIRELLQNALDEEEMVEGRADVLIEHDALGTWILDRGRGITVEALRMGGSDKECWMRGYYGEGLKLAASHLTLNGVSRGRWSSGSSLSREMRKIPVSSFSWEGPKRQSRERGFSYPATRGTLISWGR
jgi:hypothetical protein